MRISVARFLPLLTAAAMMAGCGGTTGSTIPRAPTSTLLSPAARTVQEHDRIQITCGADADDCKKIRLVAPLDATFSALAGLSLSLSSTRCGHAHVRIDPDDGLPLSPTTWNSARAGFLPIFLRFSINSMTDPCARRDGDRDGDGDHRGGAQYYIVAIIQSSVDGAYTFQTLDGPATSDGTRLTWSTPVRARSVLGTYAFYLARIRGDDHGDHG